MAKKKKAHIKLWFKRKKKHFGKVTGAERIKVLYEKVKVFKSLRKRKRKRDRNKRVKEQER